MKLHSIYRVLSIAPMLDFLQYRHIAFCLLGLVSTGLRSHIVVWHRGVASWTMNGVKRCWDYFCCFHVCLTVPAKAPCYCWGAASWRTKIRRVRLYIPAEFAVSAAMYLNDTVHHSLRSRGFFFQTTARYFHCPLNESTLMATARHCCNNTVHEDAYNSSS